VSHKNAPLFFTITPVFLGGFFIHFVPMETEKNTLQRGYLTDWWRQNCITLQCSLHWVVTLWVIIIQRNETWDYVEFWRSNFDQNLRESKIPKQKVKRQTQDDFLQTLRTISSIKRTAGSRRPQSSWTADTTATIEDLVKVNCISKINWPIFMLVSIST